LNRVGIRRVEIKGLFNRAFGSLEKREWDGDLKRRVVVQIEQMVLTPNRFVRNIN